MSPEQFIAKEIRRPLIWGVTDCAATVDRWIFEATGISPAEATGQIWHDEIEGERLLATWALPIRLARGCRRLGLDRTRDYRDGDVGAIAVGHLATCGIRYMGAWHFRDVGWCSVPIARVLMAWRVAP